MGRFVVFCSMVKSLFRADIKATILQRTFAIFMMLFATDVVADGWKILAIRVHFPLEEPDELTTTGIGSFDLRSPELARSELDYVLPYDLPPHDIFYFDYHYYC